MLKKRIFVERKEGLRTEAESLRRELEDALGLHLEGLRLLTVYDLFGFTDDLLAESIPKVFAPPATDSLVDVDGIPGSGMLAVECLPGQFDPRASWAEACVRLLRPSAFVHIRSGRLLVFDKGISADDIERIADYWINPVECRRKDLSELSLPAASPAPRDVRIAGFRDLTAASAQRFITEHGLAMGTADVMAAVSYFRHEKRDPTLTELKIIDTYWSDHCRHTTFNTCLVSIEVEESPFSAAIDASLQEWRRIRRELGGDAPPSLMDLATAGARLLRSRGLTEDVEVSAENNACGIYVDVELETDGDTPASTERWLLMFKNETHNHPTEIEPYGGASTCLGGAVRDPLSGRAYVFQAVRVSGAGDVGAPVADTLPGKLPQRVISTRAATGFSSYGNQLGIPTSLVREIFHPGYVAKRLETGAVAGAVRVSDVKRETPEPGDVVLMLGGRTGRDGIGGATGSSKPHTAGSLAECGGEVQKGNAPEERKLQRLFRRPEATRLVRRANDFGAGGVSVAVGELADGLDIYLDRIKTKYEGLSPSELAVSESQERMAVVVAPGDADAFCRLCREENIEVTHVADVTAGRRLRMMYGAEVVADLARGFLESAGSPRCAGAVVEAPRGPMPRSAVAGDGMSLETRLNATLSHPDVAMQEGLVEMFDSTVGAATVLMPFGGRTARSESQVSVQRFPTGNRSTHTASLMTFGFNPFLSEWSPFHGGAMAVTECVARAVAAGADPGRLRFSFQEFFGRPSTPERWGRPLASLLGALRMQLGFGIPAIGGKDSMSGSFGSLDVPPTLIAFGVAPVDGRRVVSTDFKSAGHSLYLLRAPLSEAGLPDPDVLSRAYADLHGRIAAGGILSAFAVGFGGVAEAAVKMALGNEVGADIRMEEDELFSWRYGAVLVESAAALPEEFYTLIGRTVEEKEVRFNGQGFALDRLYGTLRGRFSAVFPDVAKGGRGEVADAGSGPCRVRWTGRVTTRPRVFLPVFPGTNCDFDLADAFAREGAQTAVRVFRNLATEDIFQSLSEMAREIDVCHILALSGGFSAADEPDGSGKFMAALLTSPEVREAVERLLDRKGLFLGICNGFQALLRSGLLPFGRPGDSGAGAALVRNDIGRHVSRMVTTRVGSVASPWLAGFEPGEMFTVAASHGEGRFTAPPEVVRRLADAGQIAFQYADPSTGHATMEWPFNPNGSVMAIEGIVSPDGLILGKMAHSERYRPGLLRNVPGEKEQNIFRNAVMYFSAK